MKKLLFLPLCLCCLQFATAQDWPIGTTWHYCQSAGLGEVVFQHTHDSLINDTNYAVVWPLFWSSYGGDLSYESALENHQITLLRSSNDTIFRRVEQTEYVFFINGLEIGDSFSTYRSGYFYSNIYSCAPNLELEVVDISFTEIEGVEHRTVHLADMNYASVYNFNIQDTVVFQYIEGIGLKKNFPYYNYFGYAGTEEQGACDLTTEPVPGTTLYQFDGDTLKFSECNTSSIAEYGSLKFSLFPNPTSTHISLQGIALNGSHFDILDLRGRRVMQGALLERIDVSALAKGLYFLKVQNEKGEFGVEKFLVE